MRSLFSTFNMGIVILSLFMFCNSVKAQRQLGPEPNRAIDLSRGMGPINADLIQIAFRSDFFLQFRDGIDLTPEQRKKLETLFFETQQYAVQREADLDVTDAQLRRLMSNDRVDVLAVEAKLKEMGAIEIDSRFRKLKAALQAIGVLTHEQHLKVMLLFRKDVNSKSSPAFDG